MVSHRLEPEVAESKYFFNRHVKFLLILTLAVSDGGSNPLAPTPLTYRDWSSDVCSSDLDMTSVSLLDQVVLMFFRPFQVLLSLLLSRLLYATAAH